MRYDLGEKSFFFSICMCMCMCIHCLYLWHQIETILSRSTETVHNAPGLQECPISSCPLLPSSHNVIFIERKTQAYRSDRCLSNLVPLCFGKEKKSPAYSCRSVWKWPKGALTERTAGAGLSLLC